MKLAVITGGFWFERIQMNARSAIFHQWEQLEASGCIENFRITAGEREGIRAGWFFADSDAYKWLEAAVRIHASHPDDCLAVLIDDLIALLSRAQSPDGYLFTYNQILFPGVRWQNLQIEHELYCHGHLIEAGVSHYQATGRSDLFDIARKAADRIVCDFRGKGPEFTPGHEEIEIALLRLHQVTGGDRMYLEMARQFIEQRGRHPNFAISILRQNLEVGKRSNIVEERKRQYQAVHPDFKPLQLPPANEAKKPPNAALRWYASALSGKYFQQHTPVRKQTVPVGHSVRFAYLETAVAMLARASADETLLPALERAWEHMVLRRMYITGGIGSLPGMEGFGNDYELNPEYAYAETCAALASLFWNWQMAQLTGEARYSDLFEWQLYNAAGVGMGLDGRSYLYNNPLACRGGIERRPWYAVPCCPSNIARTWADLGSYIVTSEGKQIRIHQYINCRYSGVLTSAEGSSAQVDLAIESDLPWNGKVKLTLMEIDGGHPDKHFPFQLELRRPAWAGEMNVRINGKPITAKTAAAAAVDAPAGGYDPRVSVFSPLPYPLSSGDQVEINFTMPVNLRRAHSKVKGHRGMAAVTRGPLVYCLESVDNPDDDIFVDKLDPDSLTQVYDPSLLGGIVKILAKTTGGAPLTFIPYFLWGNRGASQMTVWVNTGKEINEGFVKE
jgi:uncharacterized protein